MQIHITSMILHDFYSLDAAIIPRLSPIALKNEARTPKSSESTCLLIKIARDAARPIKLQPEQSLEFIKATSLYYMRWLKRCAQRAKNNCPKVRSLIRTFYPY